MIKVGITGGIGSGKTTFCKEWEQLGAFVVYADDLAKKLMVQNEDLVVQIKSTFGEKSYQDDGSLDRSFLAKQAFENGRVEELNGLVHPVLWREIDRLAEQKEKGGVEVFVKEAAILLLNGRPKDLDFVVLLDAPIDERVDRVVDRDKTNRDLVMDRVSKQQDFNSLTSMADYIISNEGSLLELKQKARETFNEIRKI